MTASAEEILAALQACWCDALATSAGGAPASCCITAGMPALAECCSGYAWVRLVGAYPSVAFPQISNKPQRCIIDTWALQVEIGIMRCAPEPCDPTGTTCCTGEEAAAAILLDDFRQARKTFTCGCLGIPQDQIVIGAMKVVGPQGGCVGVTLNATIFASD